MGSSSGESDGSASPPPLLLPPPPLPIAHFLFFRPRILQWIGFVLIPSQANPHPCAPSVASPRTTTTPSYCLTSISHICCPSLNQSFGGTCFLNLLAANFSINPPTNFFFLTTETGVHSPPFVGKRQKRREGASPPQPCFHTIYYTSLFSTFSIKILDTWLRRVWGGGSGGVSLQTPSLCCGGGGSPCILGPPPRRRAWRQPRPSPSATTSSAVSTSAPTQLATPVFSHCPSDRRF